MKKGEKMGKKIEKFADDPQKAIDKKIKKTKKSIDKTLRNVKNDRLVKALSKAAKRNIKNIKKGANDVRRSAGFLTDAENKAIEKKEAARIRKKYGGMKIELEKKKKK